MVGRPELTSKGGRAATEAGCLWLKSCRTMSLLTALAPFARGEKLWRAKPAFPQYTPEGVRHSGNVSTVPFLRDAALQMLKQGCGEGWLLQPKVSDMPDLEYR